MRNISQQKNGVKKCNNTSGIVYHPSVSCNYFNSHIERERQSMLIENIAYISAITLLCRAKLVHCYSYDGNIIKRAILCACLVVA